MKKNWLWLLAIIVMANFVMNCENSKDEPISEQKSKPEIAIPAPNLEGFKEEMKGWAEGRWLNWQVNYNESNNDLIVRVWISPSANEIAMKKYCEIIQKLYNQYAQHQKDKHNIFLYKGQKIVHTCR